MIVTLPNEAVIFVIVKLEPSIDGFIKSAWNIELLVTTTNPSPTSTSLLGLGL